MSIPLVDLSRQHAEVEDEIQQGWDAVVANSSFILGKEVSLFEEEFASFAEVAHCVGVGSGTDALEISARALGLMPGDGVIVPANTFIASAFALLRAGLEVVLVDCDPVTMLLDPGVVADKFDGGVKALMAVHLFGQMAPVDEIRRAIPELLIIEDAAQSHGATRHGLQAGALGEVAGTSFYPSKNLGCYGDGGAVLTNRSDLADKARKIANWGSSEKHLHPVVGFNSRLDTLQAVVLRSKLKRLAYWNAQRQKAAAFYDDLLTAIDWVVRPEVLPGNSHVWHLYVIRVRNRDEVLSRLLSNGVGAGVHYPIPLHLQGAMSHLAHDVGDFPNAERAAAEMISLPLFPGITEAEQTRVVEVLRGRV